LLLLLPEVLLLSPRGPHGGLEAAQDRNVEHVLAHRADAPPLLARPPPGHHVHAGELHTGREWTRLRLLWLVGRGLVLLLLEGGELGLGLGLGLGRLGCVARLRALLEHDLGSAIQTPHAGSPR
jgi:hypothetical protein